MQDKKITELIKLDKNRNIEISTGKLARQADGAVEIRMGNTVMLATVVANKDIKDDIDFLPLTVDYREKFYAAGRFPGGFFKREARPSENEILTMRLVDRVLRPLFPKDYHAETQLMIQLLSYDKNCCAPDSLAGLAASAALTISDIPFGGPISEVRVCRINGEFVVNPKLEDISKSDIEIMVGASKESVIMVEGEMDEVSEEEMLEAIKIAHEAIKIQCEVQEKLAKTLKVSKREYAKKEKNEDIIKKVQKEYGEKILKIIKSYLPKQERRENFENLKDEFMKSFSEEEVEKYCDEIKSSFDNLVKEKMRENVLDGGNRLDGRKLDEIRQITCDIDYLPSVHGSAVFTRGETQALVTTTLGTSQDAKKIDEPTLEGVDSFYLHYNFPPFSTGEARPIRGTSRREIGHGNLAQRAIKKMLPEDFGYTVRIVSEILESNGSSSMASVCGGTLSLMDAGVPIKKPVSGIAMGLIKSDKNYAILSDILGDEDFLGDMDFKVTGTEDGITACQMDIKIQGITYEILTNALQQAKDGRMFILSKMNESMSAPRKELKDHIPQIIKIKIPKDMIRYVIGPGGKVIQELQAETNTTISIEEEDNHGVVEVFGENGDNIKQAIKEIENITYVPKVGDIITGEIKAIKPFGAFIGVTSKTDGFLHISEISSERIENIEDHLKEKDKIEVKITEIDKKTGKIRLSKKVLEEKE